MPKNNLPSKAILSKGNVNSRRVTSGLNLLNQQTFRTDFKVRD